VTGREEKWERKETNIQYNRVEWKREKVEKDSDKDTI